nr:exonuclease domain-containing protein [Roseomonas acroporae]
MPTPGRPLLRLRVIDIETTGEAPPAEVIEFGRVDVVHEHGTWRVERPMARLYRPLHGIPPETMAVHHITEADFDVDTPVCTNERLRLAIWGGEPPNALVAHNAEFEQRFVTTAATDDLPWICTYKVALRAWPEAPRHSNQVLRYWRGLRLDPSLAMPPHRAGPDAYVTASLLVELLRTVAGEEMIAWSREPRHLPALPFGKHRGLPWTAVPLDYLDWMLRQADMEADVIWCARREMQRRQHAAADASHDSRPPSC